MAEAAQRTGASESAIKVQVHRGLKRLAPVAVLGALASAAIAVAWLGCVPAERFLTAAPWIKLAYAAALAAAAGWLTARLARPVARLAAPTHAVAAVTVAMGLLGALAWAGALGAAGYALVCNEDSTAFIALWCSAGIAVTGVLGEALGPRVLRW